MVIHTFAAIDVGSYELGMKIFEISRGRGIREIDHVVRRIDLGTDTYLDGKLSLHHVQEVRDVLREYRHIMDTYRAEDYQAYGTSAIREMTNASIILSQWEEETGIRVNVLSNSEQRFLDYKSLAYRVNGFDRIMEEGCAVVDIGGSSIQISLFEHGTLRSTENLRLGVLRLREQASHIDTRGTRLSSVLQEIINSQLNVFTELYPSAVGIRNIMIIDDYLCALPQFREVDHMEMASLRELLRGLSGMTEGELARSLHMTSDNIELVRVSGIIAACILRALSPEVIYAPGVTLADGIVYEYAEKKRFLTISHDFEEDILSCARSIAARYRGNEKRGRSLDAISTRIFDATKKIHGLGKREKLLLRLACILHDCGKYVSISNAADCSYNIILRTEIIGLSHIEREIVANVVYYNHSDFVYFEEQEEASDLNRGAYLVLTKLTAILKLANGLDRAHKAKFDELRAVVRDEKLIITVRSGIDLSLERGLFQERADFFAEVFGITPVIRQK